jgi:CBS domain-containing protein
MSPELAHVLVRDCMHRGILSCSPDAPLSEVAGVMAKHGVHAVAITTEHGGRRPAGFVSDLDVVAAVASGEERTAGRAAATELLAVSADERIDRAARMMAEHGVSHLIVLDPAGGYPTGVLSTLDVAAVYATAEPS